MRRSSAPPALIAVALIVGAGCGGERRQVDPAVVVVAAQPCERPTRSLGHGVIVAEGVVVTAGHTVEGDLRKLTVDGAPASVLALDTRTDLALLTAPTAGRAEATLSDDARTDAVVLAAGGRQHVDILSTGPLVVDDVTAGVRHERQVHRFAPGVDDGTSGAPLIDEQGRLLGIVVLDNPTDGVAYAVTAGELAALMAEPRPDGFSVLGDCSG
ncbi:MAG: trypsin-like peptidase domain-containing protein [Actinomycetes bacterium]